MRFATQRTYHDRATKAVYIADKYAAILQGSVLDVGCDQKQLAGALPQGVKYTGVDMGDTADIRLNLDRENLPFPPRSFDTVVCCDVLEHLEQIHAVFDQLCTIAARRVILSLPNPARIFLFSLVEGKQGRQKYYGLPAEPEPDRHRWFFNAEEARDFVRARAARNGFEVEQLDHEDSWVSTVISSKGVHLSDHPALKDGTLWAVLARPQ